MNQEMNEKGNENRIEKLIIIGSGPAAYTAAIYAARANMDPLLLEGFMQGPVGGQLTTTTVIENFPGFPDAIAGPKLMDNMKKQAVNLGTRCITKDALAVDLSSSPFSVKTDKQVLKAHSIIIATGAAAKRLDVKGTRDGEFWQKGVTACAVCDGAAPIFRDKDLFVIGGGDTAVEEAIFLTKYGKKVYIVHRRDQLRASKALASRAKNHPKVEILWDSVLEEVKGDEVVNEVVLKNVKTNQLETKEAGGVFFAIGHKPNTGFLSGQVELDEHHYILVQRGMRTSVEGVFAAGDVQDPIYRQAITAAGTGCMAALDVERWLSEKGVI